jgi:hypothetical protein
MSRCLSFLMLLMIAMSASADVSSAATEQVFEIRTYTAAEGKLAELNARFRNHTMKLFERHGMKNVAYWIPQDGPRSSNTLVYVLAHQSRQAADKSWEAFLRDPEWQKVKAESEAKGSLVKKVESVFLVATDYSPMK